MNIKETILVELSKATLADYTQKAAGNRADAEYKAGHADATGNAKERREATKTAVKRTQGMAKAIRRLAFKEEAEVMEGTYEEAWDRAQADFKMLGDHGYSKTAHITGEHGKHPDTGAPGVRHGWTGHALEQGDRTYRGHVSFHHDLYTRAHTHIKTSFGYVAHEATPDSTPRRVTHSADHATVAEALAHLKNLYTSQGQAQ